MKFLCSSIVLVAVAFTGGVVANAVAPSVKGVVTQVVLSGSETKLTVNGQTYAINAATKSDAAIGQLHPGQTATLLLSPDGRTVLMIYSSSPLATHP